MRKRIILLVLFATFCGFLIMDLNISSYQPQSKVVAAEGTNIELGVPKNITYTNNSHINSYSISLVKDKLYNISLKNLKGCNLRARIHWSDYLLQNLYCSSYFGAEHGFDLTDIDYMTVQNMGVDGSTNWESTSKDFYLLSLDNYDVNINVYSDPGDKDAAIAWEDLGGTLVVSEANSNLYDTDSTTITNGWTSSLDSDTEGWKLKKVVVSSDGLYNFSLTSTFRDTEIKIKKKFEYEPGLENLFTMSDSATTDYIDYEQMYLCAGTYYLKVTAPIDGVSSWKLEISKLTIPTIIPDRSIGLRINGTHLMGETGSLEVSQGVKVTGIQPGFVYNWSISCPYGFNAKFNLDFADLTYDRRDKNYGESGSFMVANNVLPPLFRVNGIDIINPIKLIIGSDYSQGVFTERDYDVHDVDYPYCGLKQNGETFEAVFFVKFVNLSEQWSSQDVEFIFYKASRQPQMLQQNDTYEFSHISADDDEGIYKLPANTTGKVCGFIMKEMGDWARLRMEFTSTWVSTSGDYGIQTEWGSTTGYWQYDTYEALEYDKCYREVAILAETWVVLQDETDKGYPGVEDTHFTMNYSIFPCVSLNEEFSKEYGRDQILLKGDIKCCGHLYIEDISGISSIPGTVYLRSTDGTIFTYGQATGDMIFIYDKTPNEYYIIIRLDTSDNKYNIGTFKVKFYDGSGESTTTLIINYSIAAASLLGIILIVFRIYKKPKNRGTD